MKIYELISKEVGHCFSLNAKDLAEANWKMLGWLDYQGKLSSRDDYYVQETVDPKWIHNEYIK